MESWLLGVSLVLIPLGGLKLLSPYKAFRLYQGWKYEGLEPSEKYLTMSRVGGGVQLLIGAACLFVAVHDALPALPTLPHRTDLWQFSREAAPQPARPERRWSRGFSSEY